MKRQMFTSAALRLLFTSTLFSIALAASAESPRLPGEKLKIIQDSIPPGQPLVTYVGSDEEYFYFRIQIDNRIGAKYEIVIRDRENGTILYNDLFNDSVFMKKIAVPRDITQLKWDVHVKAGRSGGYRNSYSVSTDVMLREDVYVTRL